MKRIDINLFTALLGVVLGVLVTMVAQKVLDNDRKFDGDYNRWRKLNLILQEVEKNYVDTIDSCLAHPSPAHREASLSLYVAKTHRKISTTFHLEER